MTDEFSVSGSGSTSATGQANIRGEGVSGVVKKIISVWGTSVGIGTGAAGGSPARLRCCPGAEAGWRVVSDKGASLLLDEFRREYRRSAACSAAEDLERSRSLERAALPDGFGGEPPMTATTILLLRPSGHRVVRKASARIGCLSSILDNLGGVLLHTPSSQRPGGALPETVTPHEPPGGLLDSSPQLLGLSACSPKDGMNL